MRAHRYHGGYHDCYHGSYHGGSPGFGSRRSHASPSRLPSPARSIATVVAAVLVLAPLLFACTASPPPSPPAPAPEQVQPRDALTSFTIRRSLQEARAFRDQGRLEAALRATSRGLAVAPDEARLHRLHADLLAELGREDEAAVHRARADTLAPPPPPLPDTALEAPGSDQLLIVLLPPPAADDPRSPPRMERIPREWPDVPVAGTLGERLAVRLPAAEVVLLGRDRVEQELASVEAARSFLEGHQRARVLSLRVDRAFCGSTVEQGRWAVGWLRLASGARGRESAGVEELRRAVERPASCRSEVIARALEDAFARPIFRQLLTRDAEHADADDDAKADTDADADADVEAEDEEEDDASWSNASIRDLFPDLGLAVARRIEAGRRQLAGGNLAEAERHFLKAVAIDPEDLDASTFLAEVQLALSLSKALSRPAGAPGTAGLRQGRASAALSAEHLPPGLREAEIRALRRRLQEARSRRNELLAAIAVMESDTYPPSSSTLAVLRPSEIRDPEALGPRLARSQAETEAKVEAEVEIEARVLFAPDGAVVARYYFESAGDDPLLREPLLREEDTNGDGRPDLWTAYSGNARRELWQDYAGHGTPNLHVTFAEGGQSVVQVELDADGNGLVERRFAYEEGQLSGELRDTTGDGRFDHKESFDSDGRLSVREEDFDGDSHIDVRTHYRSGRMIRREILNPDAVDSLD